MSAITIPFELRSKTYERMNVADLKAKHEFRLRQNWSVMPEGSESNSLSLQQASDYLGVSQAAMRTWKREGKGPAFFRAGKLLKFRKVDLDYWIEARLVKPKKQQGHTVCRPCGLNHPARWSAVKFQGHPTRRPPQKSIEKKGILNMYQVFTLSSVSDANGSNEVFAFNFELFGISPRGGVTHAA